MEGDGAVMGKRSRQKRQRRREAAQRRLLGLDPELAEPAQAPVFAWADHEGLHTLVPGQAPSPDQLQELSLAYQEKMRRSPHWDQIVAELGPDAAERLLRQFRFELR